MKRIVLLLLLAVSFTACKKDDENVNVTGNWLGSYTGDKDNGVLEVSIDASGKLTGTAFSSKYLDTDNLTGTVSGTGSFTGTTTGGAKFTGKFDSKSASGTWENTISGVKITGKWTGIKDE